MNFKKSFISDFIDRYSNIFFAIMLIIYIVLLLFKLSDIPRGIHVDEAGMAYDAICISKFGVDRYLNKLPVYLINYGGGQSALYAYLEAIILKFFNFSIFSMRLPAIIISIATIIVLYITLKKMQNNKIALLITFIMIVVPWHFMKSRWALDCNLLSGMFIISICYLCSAIKSEKIYRYILSGCLFGITLYTYAISYMIIPIFLFLMIIYLIYLKKINIKQIIAFCIPLILIAMPLVLMLGYNKSIIPKINLPIVSIPTLWNYRGAEVSLKNISENLSNIYEILFSNDFLIYNGFKEFGTLYKISIPLILIGLVICIINSIKTIRKKEIHLDYVFLAAFVSSFLCMLLISKPNINKCNAIYIPMIYFAARTIYELGKKIKILVPIILILYSINAVAFYKYYFVNYANIEQQPYFEYGIEEAIDKANKLDKNNIYISYNFEQPYIYTLLVNQISPYQFNATYQKNENNIITSYNKYYFYIPENFEEDDAYIIKDNNEEFYQNKMKELQEEGYISEQFGLFRLFYK